MRIGFCLSSKGGSPLVVGLERGLTQLGHSVEYYRTGSPKYDILVVFNQSAHTTDYVYPEFPNSCKQIAFVDTSEYGYFRRLPSVIGRYANAFSEGSISHDTKNKDQQLRLKAYLEGKSFPYFLREFSKYVNFPKAYHPIDYPLYHYSVCNVPPNRDEYMARELELFVSWGASHPWRNDITAALRGCHRKCEIDVIGENGYERMPQTRYFQRTRAAKCSVSFDGYGSGSFRMTEVLCRCLLIQGPLSIKTRAPLIDGVHCVEYSVENDGEKFISTNICQKLRESLEDPERSYKIYEAGYRHCMQNLTEAATARYLLETIEAHDWSKPTALSLD